MAQQQAVTVRVPGEQWTQVLSLGGIYIVSKWNIAVYPQSGPGTHVPVDWQWFSAGIPPFMAGNFVDMAEITLITFLYTSVQIWTPVPVVARVIPVRL